MSERDVQAEVVAILLEVFDDDDIEITRATSADDVEDWDSLSHLKVINRIEAHFQVKFKLSEVMSFTDVGSMCDCIARHLDP